MCEHNQRTRYTTGFQCENCDTFFPKNSPTYRADEYINTLWMSVHNVNAKALQAGLPEIPEAIKLRDEIGIGVKHINYEEVITKAEDFLALHGVNANDAIIIVR